MDQEGNDDGKDEKQPIVNNQVLEARMANEALVALPASFTSSTVTKSIVA